MRSPPRTTREALASRLRRPRALIIGALAGAFVAPAAALASGGHPIPEHERWATVTHPGNQPYTFVPIGSNTPISIGSVGYEYQISRTEITVAEWLEFMQAYAPFVPPQDATSLAFRSRWIAATPNAHGYYDYYSHPDLYNVPVEMSWRYAAIYCNWLHNGKAPHREAFETGAYDAGTFGGSFAEGFTDQAARSPGARYWIPTLNEWTKAVHWDPDKVDPLIGDTGYWLYPHSSDIPPIGGPPDAGGESSSGYDWIPGQLPPSVALYPHARSPWGLLDASGGVSEWLEDPVAQDGIFRFRSVRGGGYGLGDNEASDHITRIFNVGTPDQRLTAGLRLARVVPSPASFTLILGVALCTLHRRRR